MMPGDSQSKMVAIAADATLGNCQNCSVLHQSLNEYVSSFLALKQKITVSDDAIRLQHQTKELQVKLVSLEKKTADYETLQEELEQKKDALKTFGQISEELEKLKQENTKTSTENMKFGDELKTAKELIKTQSLENAQLMRDKADVEHDLLQSQMALKESQAQAGQVEQLMKENAETAIKNKTLEDELKMLKELMEMQSLESARLKREKAEVENELLETQTSLKKSQLQADQIEQLMKDNAESTIMKNNLENKVGLLEESVFKQNHTIRELTKEKSLLERSIHDLQVKIIKLERERNKEYRSTSTQASVPEEPKVDKEKFRLLLENLWACVEPQQQMESLDLTEPTSKQMSPSSPLNKPHYHQSNKTHSTPDRTGNHQNYPIQTNHNTIITNLRRNQCFMQKASLYQQTQKCTKSNMRKHISQPDKQPSQTHETEESPACSPKISVEEILELFKPMLPCLSPLLDMETEVESMDTKDGDENTIFKTTDHVSRECPNSSALQTEGTVGLTLVTTQEMENSSKENDFKQKDFGDKTQIMDGEKIHPQIKEPEKIMSSSSSSSSSSTLGMTVLVEAASLPTENKEPHCSVMVDSSDANIEKPLHNIEDTEKALLEPSKPETWNNKSENLQKMEVDMGADDVTDKESPTDGDPAVLSGETSEPQPVTSLTITSAVPDDKGTSNEKDGAANCNTSGVRLDCHGITSLQSQKSTEFCREDTEQPQDNVCLSEAAVSSSIPSMADHNLRDGAENNFAIKLSGKESQNEAEGTGRTDVTASHSLSKHISRPPSPCKSPLLKMEIAGETCINQESGNANGVSPKTKDENRNSLKSEITAASNHVVSDDQLTQTPNCMPVQEPSHSICRQRSPSRLIPTIKLQALENNSNSENENIDSKHLSPNKVLIHPSCSVEEENVGNALEEAEVYVRPTVSVSFPVEQSIVETNGQNKCSESLSETSVQQRLPVDTTVQLSEFIGQARCEMGPPLPRLLTPLRTPPKLCKQINPRQAIGKLSFPSPMDRSTSPSTPVQAPTTPNNHQVGSLNSPLPPNGVPSSPLQFGSATPKHAVPVPGRLPVTAMNSSSSSSTSPSQENSMRILDTMYPELSARARTLSILRGNVNLSICSSDSGTSPATAENPISSFKSINSASTAFTKTKMRGGKRHAVSSPQPKSKCLRLGNRSPSESPQPLPSSSSDNEDEPTSKQAPTSDMTSPCMDSGQPAKSKVVVQSLQKIEQGCFDLLPVIQSHLYVGNMPKKPVLRDEEKEVIAEICQLNLPFADEIILAILNKLKDDNRVLSRHYMEALCRVYTGICRQRSDWEKAHILAYSILTEDFPDSARLILFMVTTWPTVLSHGGLLCQAIHTATKLKTPKELLSCITAYIGWDKTPPCDIDRLISRTMSEIQSRKQPSFTKHSRYGHDLSTESWEQVFTLHLLCGHKKWKWTYEEVLGKQLWPLMNTWVTQPRDQQTPVLDVTVATVIRLIGRLAQLGIKERCVSSVMTVSNVMNTFGRHGQSEGVPWEVQLAAVYCIYDLSPCNPKQALDALAGWREETSGSVPSAVTSCINQLASICRQVKS